MRKLSTFLHIIDATSEWTGKIVSFAIVLIIGTMLWLMLARYAFQISTNWSYATATKILFIYVIFGAAYVLRIRAHINVDILHKHLSLRVRSIVDLVTFTFFFLFCVALLWEAVDMVARDALRLHLSLRSFWPPNWPVTLVAPIGVFLFLLQGLAKFIRDLIIAITGEEVA